MAGFRTAKEKRAFRAGLYAGMRKQGNGRKASGNSLMGEIKEYRKKNKGALYHNGKIYDTNFTDRPVAFTKRQLRDMHFEYDVDGQLSDKQVADRYVRSMRSKYGVFDKDGNFLHMTGDD